MNQRAYKKKTQIKDLEMGRKEKQKQDKRGIKNEQTQSRGQKPTAIHNITA